MKNLITVLLLLTGIGAFAQTDTLKAEQAKNFIDKEIIVKGNVAGSRLFERDGKKTFLINLDQRYPQTPLTVVLYTEAYDALGLKEEIDGKNLVVKGVVTLYNDRPQIVVSDLKNLQILK
ncbi:MAG: hypothetical protein ACK4NY_16420 [Spirosomataceae bacterium]